MLCGLLKREAHLFKSCAQSCCPADTEVKLTISSPGPCLQDLQGFLLAVVQRKRHQVHDQGLQEIAYGCGIPGPKAQRVSESQVWARGGEGVLEGLCFPLSIHLQFQPPIWGSKIILAPHAVSVSGMDYLLC